MTEAILDPRVAELKRDLGEYVEAKTATAGAVDYSGFRENILGFARDVLGVTVLWAAQEQHLLAVQQHRRVAAYGANGCSKSFDDAIAALWWIYAWDGLCIATSTLEQHLRDGPFGRDLRTLFHRADLTGELYTLSLRRPDKPESGLLCMAAGDTHRLRSFHAPRVMVQLQEAQGLPAWAFESAEVMATGDEDRVLLSGNPIECAGPFFKRCRAASWVSVRFDATQHPNVVEGKTIIAGGPTRESLAQRAGDYGVDSAFYVASVLGEFPTDALTGLVKPAWLERAFDLNDRNVFAEASSRGRIVLGVDVARSGLDRSVVCSKKGPVVLGFDAWHGADLEVTSGRVIQICERYHIRPQPPRDLAFEIALRSRSDALAELVERPTGDPLRFAPTLNGAAIRVDTIGLGSGPHDRLRALGYPVESFNASSRPLDSRRAERYLNRRAEALFEVRDALEKGQLALPRAWADQLTRELTAINWAPNGRGLIQIEAKADIKAKLGGASPDYSDALAMAVTTGGVPTFDVPSNAVAF
jgi:hypothetical protein